MKPIGDKDQSCIGSSIDYWLVYNICELDTSAGQLTVPFTVAMSPPHS